jgi:hypothetical protein
MTKFRATNDRESHVKNEEPFQQPMREGAKKSRGLLPAITRKRAKLLMLGRNPYKYCSSNKRRRERR